MFCNLRMLSRLAEQLIEVDIVLARRPDVADFKTVRPKAIFDQPGLLDADHLLFRVREERSKPKLIC